MSVKNIIMILLAFSLISAMAFAVAFPSPFNAGNGSVIVIGSESDRNAAEIIQDSLDQGVNGSDETLQFQRSSDRLNLGENLTNLHASLIGENDLPDLLGERTFTADDGDSFDYDQEIRLSENLTFSVFQDNDINNNDPTIGIFVRNGEPILNYTLDFQDAAESEIDGTRLIDFQNTEIEILGRQYTIISASTNDRYELVSGAITDSLAAGESKSFTLNGTTYDVELVFVDSDEARFNINGQSTTSLSEGETTDLSEGVSFAVTQIDFQNFAGGIQRVEFIIGAEKLILEDGQELEFENGDTIQDLRVFIDSTATNSTYELNSITLQWNAEDDLFAAENVPAENQIIMPGFENLRIFMTDFVTPQQEELLVQNSGSDEMTLKVFVKDSNDQFDLPILAADGNVFTAIGGRSEGDRLVTSATNTVVWDDDIHEYLVASWNDDDTSESYILQLDIGTEGGNAVVDFRNHVTGQTEEDNVRVDEIATFGEVEITVTAIDTTAQTATLQINAGGSFDRIFTSEGLRILLPVTNAGAPNNINLGTAATWVLNLTEEDDDGNVAAGQSFSMVIGVDTAQDEVEVQSVQNTGEVMAGGIFDSLENDSDIRVGWIQSPLASRVELDSSGDQTFARVIYHGAESYGNVFLGVMNGNGSSRNIPIITANQASQFSGRHMIVVGGSCVNNVTAQLIDVDFPTCGRNWEDETGVGPGEFMINTYDSPFGNNRVATVVAGYEEEDTLAAARFLVNQSPSTNAGQVFTGMTGGNQTNQTNNSSL